MPSPFQSLITTGSKLWLDSVDPELIRVNAARGITGATSNPIIISDLIATGRFDDQLLALFDKGLSDEQIAWEMTDQFVSQAQQVFEPAWRRTQGDDGYVSFELDPLLEDEQLGPPHDQRVARYIELGQKWAKGHRNRMIKIPATPAGLDAIEELAAAGITLNVTLTFSMRQYEQAVAAAWRGAQRRGDLDNFKSVYSIFVSRLDVYTLKQVPHLNQAAQGMVGIVNAKRIWQRNQQFWSDKHLRLRQEIIIASTGTKRPEDPSDKYVDAFSGADILTNPPATNDEVGRLGKTYGRHVDKMPPDAVLKEIDRHVDEQAMENALMAEGIAKFADPHKKLLKLIATKRRSLTTTR